MLKYIGRFRPRSELPGEEALVVLLRGVAAGLHGNSELRQFIIAYGAVRTFAGLRAERLDGLSPITSHLRARWASLRSAGPALPSGQVVQEVDDLAEACRVGGFHRNLSFASKVRRSHSIHMCIYLYTCIYRPCRPSDHHFGPPGLQRSHPYAYTYMHTLCILPGVGDARPRGAHLL